MRLEEKGDVTASKSAKKMVEKEKPEVWEHPRGHDQGAPGAPQPRADAASPRHAGVRAGADRKGRRSSFTPWSAPRSTPTSTAIRWRSTCRCRSKRRWKR